MTLERTIVSRINAHPVSTINFAVVSFKRTSVSIAHAPQHQLKEELRLIMKMPSDQAKEMLKLWFWRASHSRIEAVRELAHKIKRHMDSILNTLRHGLSNARD